MNNDRFAALYQRFEKLVRYLRGRGRSEQDARDLAQDAMIATWSRIDTIQPGAEWSYAKKAAASRAFNQASPSVNASADPLGLRRSPHICEASCRAVRPRACRHCSSTTRS